MSQDLNNTMNGTQPSSCYWNTRAKQIGTTFALCLILLVSLAGNTVIGIIVYKTRTMRKPINFLIVNMAMSDLLFPIFAIPWDIQGLYTNSWLIGGSLGQALCKLVIFFPCVSFGVSVQSLVLIAVDRFGAVVYPLRSPLISSRLCSFFILATWIVALAFFSPFLFTIKVFEFSDELFCLELPWEVAFREFSSEKNYHVSWYVIFIFIPLLLTTILYITIYIKLKSHKIPGEQSANAGQQRQQREGNVLKMAIAIVLGFAVCWLPFAIFRFHIFYVSDTWSWSCGLDYFRFVAYFMIRINCAMNPCICFIFSRNYRIGLKTLFK